MMDKYLKSSLQDQERIEEILSKLLKYMEEKKPFLDPNVRLSDIADAINTNYKYLSQVINSELNENFSTFINRYRIEDIKKNFSDPTKKAYTIIAIAENSGFKTKSSFNSAFKNYTGKTPSQFKRMAISSQYLKQRLN